MKSLIFLVFCLCTNLCFAQVTTGKVKKRAEQKVENRANQKVDEAIDKGLDALEGLFKKKNKPAEPEVREETSTAPQGTSSPAPRSKSEENFVPVKNDFIGTVTMEYRFFKNEKEEKHSPMIIEMHLSEDATAMKMIHTKNPTALFILHLDRNKITVVTDMENEGMAMEMKMPNMDKYAEEEMKMDVKKTGNTKTIDGYHCEEYLITMDNGYTTSSWNTKELNMDWDAFQESMMAIAKMNPNSKNNYYGNMEGYPVEMITLSKNGKEKTVIKTKDFTAGTYDASLFELSGYNIMKMPSFGN